MFRLRTGLRSAMVVTVLAIIVVGCSSAAPAADSADDPVGNAGPAVVREDPYILQSVPEFTIEVTSGAVNTTGRLNKYYTCEGADASPDLSWSSAPEGTQSFVVLMEDPESDEIEGGALWTHWILYSIPPTVTELPEGLPASETLENGANHGTNDYANVHYSGPCPEPTLYVQVEGCRGTGSGCVNKQTVPAQKRTYSFYVYALDKEFELAPGATRNQVLQEIEGHVLGAGKLATEFRSTRNKIKAGGSFG